MKSKNIISPYLLPATVFLFYLFLYAPIIVLIIFSFNSSSSSHQWDGFSFRWYQELFESVEVVEALKNSLIVAFSAVFLSVFMALFYVFYGVHTFLRKTIILFYGSLAAPEIVLAVGLLSFYSFFSIPLGLPTLIAGHTLLGFGYVIPIIKGSFDSLDIKLTEAALDLGATQTQIFRKIILPLLFPSLLVSALLVFIVSLDDFIISFFCAGASIATLPVYIFSVIRSGATPSVNALSTLLLIISILLVIILSYFYKNTRALK